MNARYCEPISLKDARTFLRLHFDGVRIPWGSKCYWIAVLRFVSDQRGCYLISGVGGLMGVQVIKPASEQELRAS